MRIELKGLAAGLAAALLVVGGAFGVSAIVTHAGGKSDAPASAAQMTRNMGRMDNTMASVPSSQLVATGYSLYTQACSSCHGNNAQGGYGPNLHGLNLPDTQVATVIKNGVKGKMPAFGGKYTAGQQQALVAYVQSLKK